MLQVTGNAGNTGKQGREVVGEEEVEFASDGAGQWSDIDVVIGEKQYPLPWKHRTEDRRVDHRQSTKRETQRTLAERVTKQNGQTYGVTCRTDIHSFIHIRLMCRDRTHCIQRIY